jgi:hypothetical protein
MNLNKSINKAIFIKVNKIKKLSDYYFLLKFTFYFMNFDCNLKKHFLFIFPIYYNIIEVF